MELRGCPVEEDPPRLVEHHIAAVVILQGLIQAHIEHPEVVPFHPGSILLVVQAVVLLLVDGVTVDFDILVLGVEAYHANLVYLCAHFERIFLAGMGVDEVNLAVGMTRYPYLAVRVVGRERVLLLVFAVEDEEVEFPRGVVAEDDLAAVGDIHHVELAAARIHLPVFLQLAAVEAYLYFAPLTFTLHEEEASQEFLVGRHAECEAHSLRRGGADPEPRKRTRSRCGHNGVDLT